MSDISRGSADLLPTKQEDGMAYDTGYRYVWMGAFAEKITQHGDRIIVPLCGGCGSEAYRALNMAGGRCPACHQVCWLGPLKDEAKYRAPGAVVALMAAIQKSSRTGSATISSLSDHPEVEGREREIVEGITTMLAEPIASLEEKLAALPDVPESEEAQEAEITSGGDTESKTLTVLPSGGEMVLKEPLVLEAQEGRCTPQPMQGGEQEAIVHPSYRQVIQEVLPVNAAEMRSPQPSVGVESVPGWEGELVEAEPDGATQVPLFHLPHSFWAPEKITKEEEKNFWMLPGKADPDIFCRVSRIQRVINFRVFRQWGYYMPYAPLWVYDKMEQLVDDWVVEDICSKEKSIGNSLTHPDTVKRMAAWKFVRSIEKEWWWGRTVLRHRVHSCGRNNPIPRFFSIDVATPGGGMVEKPHPKYYIPYEDLKVRFTYMV
ncbi:hypothetical protein XELAEV_18025222mg [Xenopus laevis]|uniref:Uncharacterized protein n=1 Tax=Xenopus laevis TaxID=8355 RepID=A0A974D1T7_XENLA|nr:hypothetical protein XELAEV_18025222mg [Xenopus laevis]